MGQYKELVKEVGRKVKGLELVRAIMRPKLNMTLETLKVEDIEDEMGYQY